MKNKEQIINKLIQKNINDILYKKMLDINKSIITITKVITSKDLSISKIFISTINKDENIIKILNKRRREISLNLFKKIKTNKNLRIIFIYDVDLEEINKIDNLLNIIKK